MPSKKELNVVDKSLAATQTLTTEIYHSGSIRIVFREYERLKDEVKCCFTSAGCLLSEICTCLMYSRMVGMLPISKRSFSRGSNHLLSSEE